MYRKLKNNEFLIINELLFKAKVETSLKEKLLFDLQKSKVKPLNDGGMGSLEFFSNESAPKRPSIISEAMFVDKDGVRVILTIYLDQNNNLYEFDVWKTDSSPLISLPSESKLDFDM